jgi:major membrane immunogen (membrane-anchored lipoprotein)
LIAGCGSQPTEVMEDGETVIVEENTSDDEGFKITMSELYKKGGKVTCTMTSYEEGIEMNGTLYMDGDDVRTDAR